MPFEYRITEASRKSPYLALAVMFDPKRFSELAFEIDQTDDFPVENKPQEISGFSIATLCEQLLDQLIRLFHTLENPMDSKILSKMIIDEIYYLILSSEYGSAIRSLLHKNNRIRKISKAVEYINEHMDQAITVDELAESVKMGSSNFQKQFKDIMQLSPLQYVKSIKLNHAKIELNSGRRVNEVGYGLGYNSPGQFSREYKRFFGISPSDEIRRNRE